MLRHAGRDTPLDDEFKQLMRELSPYAGDLEMLGVVDLFNEIEKAVHAERDKPCPKTAVKHWGSVKEAIDQIKRRAIKR
jgi:hypothetical protein